jgi:hypothetical protein
MDLVDGIEKVSTDSVGKGRSDGSGGWGVKVDCGKFGELWTNSVM